MVNGNRAQAVETTRLVFERGSAYKTMPGQVWGVPGWNSPGRVWGGTPDDRLATPG